MFNAKRFSNKWYSEVLGAKFIDMGNGYHKIKDDDLYKLTIRIADIKQGYNTIVDIYTTCLNELNKYRCRAHIYKIELGRCVRKLTKLYKLIKKCHFSFDSEKSYEAAYYLIEIVDKETNKYMPKPFSLLEKLDEKE